MGKFKFAHSTNNISFLFLKKEPPYGLSVLSNILYRHKVIDPANIYSSFYTPQQNGFYSLYVNVCLPGFKIVSSSPAFNIPVVPTGKEMVSFTSSFTLLHSLVIKPFTE